MVKVQEADQADIYSFGTKLGPGTVLLQIDEFEGKTAISKMKNLLEPHNAGFEIRTGPSKGRKTHDLAVESARPHHVQLDER